MIVGNLNAYEADAPFVADVCNSPGTGEYTEQEKANCRLIKAAPELLFALEALIEYAQDTMPQELDGSLDVWTLAKAAIAKATE